MSITSGPGLVSLDDFITARLDEDELIATNCRDGDWFTADAFAYPPTGFGAPLDHRTDPTPELDADALHAARQSPARVLAQVAAGRAIVAEHRASRSPVHRAGVGIALKALASVWADHPDYDPTWRLSRARP